MAEINIWLLTFQILLANAFGVQNSKYLKTKVLNDSKTCFERYDGKSILNKERPTRISCSRLCTNTDNCRRFMYNLNSKLCFLFTSGENCYVEENESTEPYVCYRQRFVCNELNCTRCPIGLYGSWCENTITDCIEGVTLAGAPDILSLSYIQPSTSSPPFEIVCRFKFGPTLITARNKGCSPVDFNRSWSDYENGFGNLRGDFWIGLRRMRDILLSYSRFHLTIKLILTNSPKNSVEYETIRMTDSSDSYRIYLKTSDKVNDPAIEALIGSLSINGTQFSTYDRDMTTHDCPRRFNGGWWYVDDATCSEANPNGRKINANAEANWGWKKNSSIIHDVIDIRIRLRRI